MNWHPCWRLVKVTFRPGRAVTGHVDGLYLERVDDPFVRQGYHCLARVVPTDATGTAWQSLDFNGYDYAAGEVAAIEPLDAESATAAAAANIARQATVPGAAE